ncbi:hypothetical protein H8K52_07585 [Undibacterium seohonense]|jgi:hypothetical protein|uniref:Uncharacterized protein n=1 Tax=Undibacterium seohonense TaxID=1344950 RepID=A0ABR6X339_9BURK|nr:hypothetical protein [Undibacterium seohonense]MBC3807206.1 hypothetical protein [Undibacterium seohonense]
MPHYRVLPPILNPSPRPPVGRVSISEVPAKHALNVQGQLRQKALQPRRIGFIYLVPAMIMTTTLLALGLWFFLAD